MRATKSSPSLASVGERSFLRKFLPRLAQFQSHRFLVPPGDDAAVLKAASPAVLSIDGLAEGTHFHSRWDARCRRMGGFSLARGLGWKLLGSSLSDLAAMGDVNRRWAMIFLGATKRTDLRFLNDFYRGLRETAREFGCALAGGDTVKANELSLAAAVGGNLAGPRALTRRGAQPGDLICVAGAIGDASVGLRILQNQASVRSRTDAAYFVRRFFKHEPLFEAGALLSREKGVTSLMDVSDALQDTIEIMCEASRVGADVSVEQVPVSPAYRRYFKPDGRLLAGGEDYALFFTLRPRALSRLSKKLKFAVIGEIRGRSNGIRLFLNGKAIAAPARFQHFK